MIPRAMNQRIPVASYPSMASTGPGRIRALERFIAHVRATPGVWCATRLQIAQAFAAATPAPVAA